MAHPYCPSETALSSNSISGEDGGATPLQDARLRQPESVPATDLVYNTRCKNKVA